MTPRQLLNKLEAEAVDEIGKARYEGALVMHQAYLDKQRRYYAAHRDHHNEYQREYRKNKAKEVDAGE